jgi:hypothetical protein
MTSEDTGGSVVISDTSSAPGHAENSAKEIKKSMKKDGQEVYLVVFEGDETDSERWLSETELNRPDLIEQFKGQKKRARGSGHSAGAAGKKPTDARQIQEIRGLLGNGSERMFVVRFVGTDKDEAVPKAMMHKLYAKELLKYYEAHIEIAAPPVISKPPIVSSQPLMSSIPGGLMAPRPYFMPTQLMPGQMMSAGMAVHNQMNVQGQMAVPGSASFANPQIQKNQM